VRVRVRVRVGVRVRAGVRDLGAELGGEEAERAVAARGDAEEQAEAADRLVRVLGAELGLG
jgi:hypothetical protein